MKKNTSQHQHLNNTTTAKTTTTTTKTYKNNTIPSPKKANLNRKVLTWILQFIIISILRNCIWYWKVIHRLWFTRIRISTIFYEHNQYVQIKQFFKVGIKNNVSTVIWLIKFLVYQWSTSAPSGGSRVVYIFVYITKSVFSLTPNHIFVHFNHYDAVLW